MKHWRALLWTIAATLGTASIACAQDAPALQVTARLQAPAQVQVGATVRLELEVMTPTWFTQPPQLPALQLPGVMVTPPSGQGAIVRDQRNGVAYSGLRYTYVLSPTEAGAKQVPALTVSAQVGPGGAVVTAASRPFTFDVTAGAAADGGMATGQLTISQDYALAPDPLVRGGRVTRTVTQRAEGVQAMLLPAAPLADVPGFKRYPREPEVTTLTDGRGAFVGGQRVDRADYVAQDTGSLGLPAISMRWRDSRSGEIRQQTLPGRQFPVSAAAAGDPPFSLEDDLARLRHGLRWVLPASWLAWSAGAVVVALLIWLSWPWWRRGAQAMQRRLRQARARQRAGERWHWRAWRREARREPASLSAFYRWLRVANGAGDLRAATAPLGAADQAAAETALRGAYGGHAGAAAWRAGLVNASRRWRRVWRRQRQLGGAQALPQALNPWRAAGPANQRHPQGAG